MKCFSIFWAMTMVLVCDGAVLLRLKPPQAPAPYGPETSRVYNAEARPPMVQLEPVDANFAPAEEVGPSGSRNAVQPVAVFISTPCGMYHFLPDFAIPCPYVMSHSTPVPGVSAQGQILGGQSQRNRPGGQMVRPPVGPSVDAADLDQRPMAPSSERNLTVLGRKETALVPFNRYRPAFFPITLPRPTDDSDYFAAEGLHHFEPHGSEENLTAAQLPNPFLPGNQETSDSVSTSVPVGSVGQQPGPSDWNEAVDPAQMQGPPGCYIGHSLVFSWKKGHM